ncbi:hypothetical protein [Paraburkholderia sp. RL18-085-BIA-A]|uniref:hypothetical protein n=1 Tax=Paraburkholderia sp. RL18-085-BIA-A TaxID=3031633 RepID=UPI0038B8CF33
MATFIERRRVYVELLVGKPHGRLQTIALLVVALDKLWPRRRVSTCVHELVPVVTGRTQEKESLVIDFRFDLIKVERHIAVSTGPHSGLRRSPEGILA